MIKKAHLTLDALGMMAVKTTYDERLVALIREIPGQRAPLEQRAASMAD